ncbi:MAG: hypothetical protein ACYTHJ_07920 [Planctomycetota bacterium]
MWQKKLQPLVDSGALMAVGVVQEQHPERARLYAQWSQLQWPIFVDSLNLLDFSVVPVVFAIDESGIVRHTQLRVGEVASEFVSQTYGESSPDSVISFMDAPLDALVATARSESTSENWMTLGKSCFLHEQSAMLKGLPGPGGAVDATTAFTEALSLDMEVARGHFRLGVAFRQRFDSAKRRPGDAQAAINCWMKALALQPNQYIWRRRIQQYGPRLDKPYDFYTWVAQARTEIGQRGETPLPLRTEPVGSEVIRPARKRAWKATVLRPPTAGENKIQRDSRQLINMETMVTPGQVKPGGRVSVQLGFEGSPVTKPYWNNEADPLTVRLDPPEGITLGEGSLTAPSPSAAESRERRSIQFELAIAGGMKTREVIVPGYALYYVCENAGGKCRYLRQDFQVHVHVDPGAVDIR